jgi:hypothetical protein
VQREYLGDQTRELAMEERGQTWLVCLRRSAALHVDGVAGRRNSKNGRPWLQMDLLDGTGDRDAERTTRVARPRVNLIEGRDASRCAIDQGFTFAVTVVLWRSVNEF